MTHVRETIRIVPLALVFALILGFLDLTPAFAAHPVIHAAWDEGGSPELDVHYFVSTDPPASPDFPDVELLTGSLTWQIWSTDTDNPDDIGDIGVISSPHPNNFAVTIRNDSDPFLRGARDVKGITLVPSSLSYYSNITEARITGTLQDDLILQANTSGAGGEVDVFHISGGVTADMTIQKILTVLAITPEFSGTMVIDELVGELSIGVLSGSVNIATTSETVFGPGFIRIYHYCGSNDLKNILDLSRAHRGQTALNTVAG